MKRLIFILIFISFSSTSFPQWLVDGGNLIWPYGNISIPHGTLTVDSTLNVFSIISKPIGYSDYWMLDWNRTYNIPGDNGYLTLTFVTSDYGEGGDDFGKDFYSMSPEEGFIFSNWNGNPLDGSYAQLQILESLGIYLQNTSTPIKIGDPDNRGNGTILTIDDSKKQSSITTKLVEQDFYHFISTVSFYVNNLNYDWMIQRNDFPVSVSQVKWDSTQNAVVLIFNNLLVNFNNYDIPDRQFFNALVKNGASYSVVLANAYATNDVTYGNAIFVYFYNASAPFVPLTESDFTEGYFSLDAWITNNNSADYQYQSSF